MTEPSIYLSYRPGYSDALALALFHSLRAERYDTYLHPGALEQRDAVDFGQIAARTHFLVLIAPGVVETLQKPDDLMRLEIDQAVRTRRGIVPLLANGFSFGSINTPDEISFLRRYYALPLTPETLAETVSLLKGLLVKPIFGQVAPPPHEQPEVLRQRLADAERQPDPDENVLHAEAVYNHGRGRNRQDYSGRLADYNEALRLNPEHLAARFERAFMRRRSGDEAAAIADYDELLSRNPNDYKSYNNRAEMYFALGAYRRALVDFEQALALKPRFTVSVTGKALTLHALGRVDEALSLWKPLLGQNPHFDDALWVGKELILPSAMIDEAHRLVLRLDSRAHASDD
ncbi:MAG: tetratricopeptide repeat protein [Chloroflexota bacterium]